METGQGLAACSRMFLAHSETAFPVLSAAFVTALNSDGVTRARTIRLFDCPAGSLGLPSFIRFCATKSSLLNLLLCHSKSIPN